MWLPINLKGRFTVSITILSNARLTFCQTFLSPLGGTSPVGRRTRIVFGGVPRRRLTGADVAKACRGPLAAANQVQPTEVVILYI